MRKILSLLCMGLSVSGDHDLSAAELAEGEEVSADLHRATRWELPPNPHRLAAAEGVALSRAPWGEEIIFPDRAYYRVVGSGPEQGLWVAHALAGAILRRRGGEHSEVRAWCLAAQLLVPAWVRQAEVLLGHPWAPRWLVELRLTLGSRESAPGSAPISSVPRT